MLAASIYAYMSWNAWLIFPIAGTVVVSYVMSHITSRSKSKKIRRLCLIITLTVCLGLLIFFKYFSFLVSTVTDFINLFIPEGARLSGFVWDIILPVGISFYTFQTLSYVIDVYRGTIQPEKHFGYYALFVIFFPQLVAGPIERPQNLLPQLKAKQTLNRDDLAAGVRWMLSGFVKKCLIADFCGTFVNAVYANYGQANSLAILVATLLFLVQVYCDFAGYSEIAMGAARMMGIRLMRNFDRPYLALSVGDFVRRWHISLTTWFKDYVYIPLGGNRKSKARNITNIIIVFALSGLWHGANLTYLCWGLYIGMLLCLEGILKKPVKRLFLNLKIDINTGGCILIRRILFFILFIPSTLMFRSATIIDFGLMFSRIFTEAGFGSAYISAAFGALGITVIDFIQLILCLVLLYKIHNIMMFRDKKPNLPIKEKLDIGGTAAMRYSVYTYLVLAVALSWLILIASNAPSAFVYFQF